MCWREPDVMVLVGEEFSPQDVLQLVTQIVSRTGATTLEYHDKRGPRCLTGQARDERYHVPMTVGGAEHCWRIDLTLWLHDPHVNVTNWQQSCASASPPNSAALYCASKTYGTGGRNTPFRSAVWTSTLR